MNTKTAVDPALDALCINTLRTLSVDAVEEANSGHPGLPLGAAPMAYVLWTRHLRHAPSEPHWANRDRFVLSAGHGSMLLYALLYTTGYEIDLEELQHFRQWGSRLAGHPEFGALPGVEATTGPLGQGSANAVGMALAERMLAARYNRPGHAIVDHATYALVSDGDLMEGLSNEAASLAGHWKLGKLVYLYDANDVTLDGPAALAFSEDVGARYAALGWQVLEVEHGDSDLEAIDRALSEARAERARPSLIRVRTTIGFGSPKKAGSAAAHGSPLGAEETRATKLALGWDPDQRFHVPEAALEHLRSAREQGAAALAQWEAQKAAWARAFPELAQEWERIAAGRLPADFESALPRWKAGESIATRSAGGKVLNALAAVVPELCGGDADLSGSTKTSIAGGGSFDGAKGTGRNLHFGVREHAMGAIANGMLYHGGLRPYTATFFVFSDYMRPAVRLAALAELPSIYVWTHDSIAVGEDGPTHEPIEHLASLRAMPRLRVVRPADANETAFAWRDALKLRDRPTALVLSRQDLPVLPGTAELGDEGVAHGAYVLADGGGLPDAIVIATGSEVQLALGARERLATEGLAVRVVSMPCWEDFAEAPEAWRARVLPPAVRARVSVEAGATLGWERWIGAAGVALGIDRFGASAPGETNLERFGFSVDAVVSAVRMALARP